MNPMDLPSNLSYTGDFSNTHTHGHGRNIGIFVIILEIAIDMNNDSINFYETLIN